MTPVAFPQCNVQYLPPADLAESQCATIPAYHSEVSGGSVDGSRLIVVAWKPNPCELEQLLNGGLIFLSCIGGLNPHFLTTDFESAIRPA